MDRSHVGTSACCCHFDQTMCTYVTIFSTVATFGLGEACMFYENASIIRVCAEQKDPVRGCGVEFPFSVNLTATSRGTAGKYVHVLC